MMFDGCIVAEINKADKDFDDFEYEVSCERPCVWRWRGPGRSLSAGRAGAGRAGPTQGRAQSPTATAAGAGSPRCGWPQSGKGHDTQKTVL